MFADLIFCLFFKTLSAIQSGLGIWFTLMLSSALVTASSVNSQSLKGIKFGWAEIISKVSSTVKMDFIGVFNGKKGCKGKGGKRGGGGGRGRREGDGWT